jgi:hypothetical protein
VFQTTNWEKTQEKDVLRRQIPKAANVAKNKPALKIIGTHT